jgi:hypothetical protein
MDTSSPLMQGGRGHRCDTDRRASDDFKKVPIRSVATSIKERKNITAVLYLDKRGKECGGSSGAASQPLPF